MANRFDDASKKAAQQTDEELSQEIAKVTNLSPERLNALFPIPADKANLKELMDIVNSATDDNNRLNQLRDKIETCGTVALKLLKAYANPLG
ncbi:MAG: hypothetical protein LHV68_08805 [Elusimicrobia bacterium]|nr:hypothetical protein [Candidatus Liberimonas magnetica]